MYHSIPQHVTAAALFAFVALVPNAAAARPSDRVERVSELMDAAHDRGESPELTGATLAALGPDYLAALLSVHEKAQTERPLGRHSRQTRPLAEDDWSALHIALTANEWSAVEALVRTRFAEEPSTDISLHSLEVFAAVAPDGELASLHELTVVGKRGVDRDVQIAFGAAVSDMLARSPEAAAGLRDLYRSVDPSLLRPLIEGAGTRTDHPSVHALVGLLGVVPEADGLVLIQTAEVAKRVRRPVPEDLLGDLRPALRREARGERLEAVKALGRMDDVGSIPALIERLEDADPLIRKEARIALQAISGERLGSDAAIWTHWYEGAREWLDGEFPSLHSDLRSADESRTSRALLHVARYRVFRHDLVGPVAETLAGASDNTAIVACSVLGHFATPDSIPPLIETLDHRSTSVRRAAYDALRRATGVDHGEHPAGWRASGW